MDTNLAARPVRLDLLWGPFAEVEGGKSVCTPEQARTVLAEALAGEMLQNSKPNLLVLAAQTKGRILFVGYGTIPVLVLLGDNARDVIGVTEAAEVAESFRQRLAASSPDLQSHIRLLQSDPTHVDLNEKFPLIFLSSFTLALMDQERKTALLRNISRHLDLNGILAVYAADCKPVLCRTGKMAETELLLVGKTVAGKLGWKLSDDGKQLIVNCSGSVPQKDGRNIQVVEATQVNVMVREELENLLYDSGLVVLEEQSLPEATSDGEQLLLRCRRRADVSYPLWHPFLPMNGLEQQVAILVEGKGCKVRDRNGREFIDASGGLWNVYCGLGEEEIIEAITDQLHRLSYGTLFAARGNEPAIDLARELVGMAPAPLQWCYLTGSGSESVELSIKVARLYNRVRDRRNAEIVYLDESFHGTFFGSMSISGSTPLREMVEPLLPGVSSIPSPDPQRCPPGMSYVDFAVSCAQALETKAVQGGVAAFIVEPVLSSAGVVIPPPEYFRRVEQICRQYDILLILDEVATGFGRTGRWFAAEHYGLRPDVLLLSKGMNSGYLPIGAVLFSAKIGEALMKRGFPLFHGSTFNGHPVCCAAALANLKVMRRKELVARAAESGAYFRDQLDTLRSMAAVKEVRALGLLLSVILRQDDGSPASPMQIFLLFRDLQKRGILGYMAPSALIFAPALVISQDEIDEIVRQLKEVLASVSLRNGALEHV